MMIKDKCIKQGSNNKDTGVFAHWNKENLFNLSLYISML